VQGGVGAGLLGDFGQLDGVGRVVRAAAGDHRHPPRAPGETAMRKTAEKADTSGSPAAR
jgi:hypothetical protein